MSGLNADYAKPFVDEKDLQGLQSASLSMLAELSTPTASKIKFDLKELLVSNVAAKQAQFEISDLSVKTSSVFLVNNLQALSIQDLVVNVAENGQHLLSTAISGEVDLKSFTSKVKVNELAVKRGVDLFVAKDLKDQFGVQNINLLGKNIELNYENGTISTAGQLSSKEIALGGQMFNKATISQDTSFELSLSKDKNVEIKKISVGVSSDRFSDILINVAGKLAPPAAGKVSESEVRIDAPTVINADQLLGLLQKSKDTADGGATQEAASENQPTTKAPDQPASKPQLKATLTSNIKGVVLEGQKVSDISTKAILNNEDIALEKLDMLIGETLLHIEGAAHIGQKKKAEVAVSSKGFIDISPVNAFINKGTERQVLGLIEVESLKVTTEGTSNDEFLNNLIASGVINMKDIQAKKYANISSVLSTTADLVLGVNPDHIHFTEGKFDVAVKDKVVTLNECRFQGKSFMVNPIGTLALTDTSYEINMNSEAGFGGGQLIQTVMGVAGGGQVLKQLAGKSKSLDRFNQSFEYSDALKLFTLKDTFKYQKSIPIEKDENSSLTADFLSSVISYAAEVGKMKNDEIGRLQKIASGKGNFLEEALGLGIDRYNKKNKIDQESETKEGEPVKKKRSF